MNCTLGSDECKGDISPSINNSLSIEQLAADSITPPEAKTGRVKRAPSFLACTSPKGRGWRQIFKGMLANESYWFWPIRKLWATFISLSLFPFLGFSQSGTPRFHLSLPISFLPRRSPHTTDVQFFKEKKIAR